MDLMFGFFAVFLAFIVVSVGLCEVLPAVDPDFEILLLRRIVFGDAVLRSASLLRNKLSKSRLVVFSEAVTVIVTFLTES